jgi:hypothetical protein
MFFLGYNAEPDVVDLFVKLEIIDQIGNLVDANAFGHVHAHVVKSVCCLYVHILMS